MPPARRPTVGHDARPNARLSPLLALHRLQRVPRQAVRLPLVERHRLRDARARGEQLQVAVGAVRRRLRCVLYKRFSLISRFQHLIASPFN